QPVVALRGRVSQQQRRPTVDGNECVNSTVVIKIAYRQAASRKVLRKRRAGGSVDILEYVPRVVKQEQRLFVHHMAQMLFDLIVRMTVHEEQVDVPVVVIIEEFHAPS